MNLSLQIINGCRSLALDRWTKKQLIAMIAGGNKNATDYFASGGLQKPYDYGSALCQEYRKELEEKVVPIIKIACVLTFPLG